MKLSVLFLLAVAAAVLVVAESKNARCAAAGGVCLRAKGRKKVKCDGGEFLSSKKLCSAFSRKHRCCVVDESEEAEPAVAGGAESQAEAVAEAEAEAEAEPETPEQRRAAKLGYEIDVNGRAGHPSLRSYHTMPGRFMHPQAVSLGKCSAPKKQYLNGARTCPTCWQSSESWLSDKPQPLQAFSSTESSRYSAGHRKLIYDLTLGLETYRSVSWAYIGVPAPATVIGKQKALNTFTENEEFGGYPALVQPHKWRFFADAQSTEPVSADDVADHRYSCAEVRILGPAASSSVASDAESWNKLVRTSSKRKKQIAALQKKCYASQGEGIRLTDYANSAAGKVECDTLPALEREQYKFNYAWPFPNDNLAGLLGEELASGEATGDDYEPTTLCVCSMMVDNWPLKFHKCTNPQTGKNQFKNCGGGGPPQDCGFKCNVYPNVHLPEPKLQYEQAAPSDDVAASLSDDFDEFASLI